MGRGKDSHEMKTLVILDGEKVLIRTELEDGRERERARDGERGRLS